MIIKSGTITLIMKRKMNLQYTNVVGVDNIRECKMLQQRRQRKRQKRNSLVRQNNIFARPTHVFIYFFAFTTTIKMPKFTFYGGR